MANSVRLTNLIEEDIQTILSRPLPEDYLRYAREDTHYLLYIYDLLRNLLIKKNPRFLRDVYDKSKIICQKVILIDIAFSWLHCFCLALSKTVF